MRPATRVFWGCGKFKFRDCVKKSGRALWAGVRWGSGWLKGAGVGWLESSWVGERGAWVVVLGKGMGGNR